MYNFGMLACATLALGLLAGPTTSPVIAEPPVETVQLAWKLAKEKTYRVETTAVTATETVTAGQEQSESQTVGGSYAVFVEDVTEDGNMVLKITVDMFSMEKESAQFDVSLLGERDEDGDVIVDVELTSDLDLLTGSDVQELFEELVHGSMGVEYQMTINPRGEVLRATINGDPLEDLPSDTELTEMIADTAKLMVNADDMPGILAAQIFSVLPEDAVRVGAEWDFERTYAAGGIEMDGAGTCKLAELKDDNSTALIRESLTFSVGASGLSENMVALIERMLGDAEMDIAVDLSGDDIDSVGEIEFDIRGGFHRTMSTSDVVSMVSGTMTMGDMEMDIEVETDTSSTSQWSLVEDE